MQAPEDGPVRHLADRQARRNGAAARQVEVRQDQTERDPPEGRNGRRRKHPRKPRRSLAGSRLKRGRKLRSRHRARSRRRRVLSRSRCARPAPPSRNPRRSSSPSERGRRRRRRLGMTCSKEGTSRATTSHSRRRGICWRMTSLNGPFCASCKRKDGVRGSHVGYWMRRRCADVGGFRRHQLHCMWTWPTRQEGDSGFWGWLRKVSSILPGRACPRGSRWTRRPLTSASPTPAMSSYA